MQYESEKKKLCYIAILSQDGEIHAECIFHKRFVRINCIQFSSSISTCAFQNCYYVCHSAILSEDAECIVHKKFVGINCVPFFSSQQVFHVRLKTFTTSVVWPKF